MSVINTFTYHFYPVGQGLFSSGTIREDNGDVRFLWVYDCGSGTDKKYKLVDNAIAQLEREAGRRKHIDLLTISHFDKDHISGVCDLLSKFSVGTLLLPYMSLAQRLITLFEESRKAGGQTTDFYLDPVEYLLRPGGPGIRRIRLVMPSRNEGPPLGEFLNDPPLTQNEDFPIDFDREANGDEAEDYSPGAAADAKQYPDRVRFLRPGSRGTVANGVWEFVPYNDDPPKKITNDFVNDVEQQRDALLASQPPDVRGTALAKLKKLYDNRFGTGSKNRNVISLFLYSGPEYSRLDRSLLACALWKWRSGYRWYGEYPIAQARCSILYTGDGFLDKSEKLDNLVKYFSSDRISRTGVIQVMHHGSKLNSYKGVADAISPLFSVFSSDPVGGGHGHPHAEVVHDFRQYNPAQVDTNSCFYASGILIAR